VTEEILDWRPYRYFTLRGELPMLGKWVMTQELRPIDENTTELLFRGERLRGWRAAAWRAMKPMMKSDAESNYDRLDGLLAAETRNI
jgi:hypothetical protein